MISLAGKKTGIRLKLLFTAACLCVFSMVSSGAKVFDFDDFTNAESRSLSNTKADSWSIVGKNIVVKGNVYIPYGDITIYADRAIVNTESKDIEAAGNIRLYKAKKKKANVPIADLVKLQAMPEVMVKILGYSVDPLGNQTVDVEVYTRGDMIKASQVSGNLSTGVISITDFEARYKTFVCKAKSGTRKPGGEVNVQDAEISSCEYLENNEGHYSICCSEANIYPYASDNFGFNGYNPDIGDHSIWGYNCKMKVFGVPVFWVPVFYKPKDESPGLFQVRGGYSSDWGMYLGLSKKFILSDYPYASTKMFVDLYTLRGVGYGNETIVETEYSKTDIFGYGLYDAKPYQTSDVQDTGRLTIPHARYDFRLSNVTHITPTLDFRGNFEITSDYYFRNDFFPDAFNANPEPATYAALEQQFDRLSTSLYIRPRVNNFYTAVEQLPGWRMDVPRQELFKNIYYQGETSVSNMRMMWRDFDKPRTTGNMVEPSNYSSLRFDTLHMFYYPFKLDWLNLIPRAGFRMNYYQDSSKKSISEQDLDNMFAVNNASGDSNAFVKNYDHKGGGEFRAIGEFGLEANTKVYQSWQNTKNAFWALDGMRHVFEPYINYTYIPDPTVDREHLYYFDDIDRIESQNFARLGMLNRLQTRRGPYGGEKIYNWMSMENYWDYHFQTQDGFNNIGDFCTKLNFSPFEDTSITSLLSLNAGDNSFKGTKMDQSTSSGGIGGDFFNKWELMLKYKIIEDLNVHFGYAFQNYYSTQSAYSMGSTLTQLESGSAFDQNYNTKIQTLVFGFDHPFTMDRTLKGAYEIFYDFEAGYVREIRSKISKTLHCWELAVELSRSTNKNSSGDKEYKNSIMVTMNLVAMETPLKQVNRQSVPGSGTGSSSGGSSSGGSSSGGGTSLQGF